MIGLYNSLTGDCRPFPRAENDDCKEGIYFKVGLDKKKNSPTDKSSIMIEGFCQLWYTYIYI